MRSLFVSALLIGTFLFPLSSIAQHQHGGHSMPGMPGMPGNFFYANLPFR